MRSTTAILSLLAAAASSPFVLAAPIPGGFSSEWEHRLAAVAGRTSLRVHALTPEAAAALADETGPSTIIIDNRHYTPSGDIAPSAVLATPRPIVTTYLMGLGATKTPAGGVASTNKPVPIRVHNTHEGIEVVIIDTDVEKALEAAKAIAGTPDSVPIVTPVSAPEADPSEQNSLPDIDIPASLRMEAQFAHPRSRAGELPCHYAQLRRDYNDMMVISLVAVFLLVIVAVELWDSSDEQTTDDQDAPVGAIKLADDSISEKLPLSVQASPVALLSTQPASINASE
ncbi:hypothetical protein SEUCBS139899_003531 [Sporothrix eucalyptigena]|uniref:Protein BIG1 n=1 Tax=Sporothrix eucalyptigena TaxID=1812306 RepID=A0ABP0B6L0_9PEZI